MFAIGDKEWPGISKLVEEAGEVTQVCGKLMGSSGDIHHFDGTNLKDRLEDELADVHAAIVFVINNNPSLDKHRIVDRMKYKLALFERWHAGAD